MQVEKTLLNILCENKVNCYNDHINIKINLPYDSLWNSSHKALYLHAGVFVAIVFTLRVHKIITHLQMTDSKVG